jgi:hypothetical protein
LGPLSVFEVSRTLWRTQRTGGQCPRTWDLLIVFCPLQLLGLLSQAALVARRLIILLPITPRRSTTPLNGTSCTIANSRHHLAALHRLIRPFSTLSGADCRRSYNPPLLRLLFLRAEGPDLTSRVRSAVRSVRFAARLRPF